MKSRRLLIVAGIFLLILIVLVVAAPFLIDVDRFRPAIEANLQTALGRPVEIGHLQFSLLLGSVEAQAITIGDDPSFSRSPFLRAETLAAGVDIWPLLRSRELRIHSITIERPQVNLIRAADGRWNFSTLGAQSHSDGRADPPGDPPGDSTSQPSEVSIGRLNITGGTITLSRHGGGAQQTLRDVSLDAQNIAPGATIPLAIAAKTPGGGRLKLEGTTGPLDPNGSLEHVTVHLKLDTQKLPAQDLEGVLQVLGYNVPAGSKFQGGTINSSLSSDGPLDRIVTAGQISVTDVRLTGFDLASKLGPLMALRGNSRTAETRIQSMSGHIRQSLEGLRVDDLVMVVPPLGTISGAGTVSPDNRLNFRMTAKLSAKAAAGPLGALGRIISGQQGAGGAIPFLIEGTTSNPQFVPELGGIGKQAGGKVPAAPGQKLGGAIGGLLQRRKP
jgi:hypothetical protein